jgi:hypothetical protein
MSTVTFTQSDNGIASVSIIGKVVYGTTFYKKRINHFILPIVDGTEKVYDAGPYKIYGTILMKDISVTDKDALDEWLTEDIILSKNRFTLNALVGINWGLGLNTSIPFCRYPESDTKDLFEHLAPGIYNMTFPYMAVIS